MSSEMDTSEPLPELYLILHKVRGEPAFDIAQIIGEDSDGEVWIIPTSGHRAYPFQFIALNELALPELAMIPDNWPDHYKIHEQREKYGDRVNALLRKLGLKRHQNLGVRPL